MGDRPPREAVRPAPGARARAPRVLSRRSTIAAIAVSIAIAAGTGATGVAHDTHGPQDAAHTWLPTEQWVARHWIPFDEQALKSALGLRGRELEAYLYNDHRTLAALARRRGVPVEALVERLVATWRLPVGDPRLPVLRDRTLRILTQGHLAQHVFFHVFHGLGLRAVAPALFGVSGARYWRLRNHGRTPLEIARLGGASRALRGRMIRLLRGRRDEGVRSGIASPLEAGRIFGRQLRALDCWLRRPLAGDDPANPYGKAHDHHGHHARGWPATRVQQRRLDRRVERIRRSLPKSCWRRPPPWRPGG